FVSRFVRALPRRLGISSGRVHTQESYSARGLFRLANNSGMRELSFPLGHLYAHALTISRQATGNLLCRFATIMRARGPRGEARFEVPPALHSAESMPAPGKDKRRRESLRRGVRFWKEDARADQN